MYKDKYNILVWMRKRLLHCVDWGSMQVTDSLTKMRKDKGPGPQITGKARN